MRVAQTRTTVERHIEAGRLRSGEIIQRVAPGWTNLIDLNLGFCGWILCPPAVMKARDHPLSSPLGREK
ncbi:hypothetical protein MPLB_280091 [Mesorhizobium sp. ORS 3324]|nr:hypothetical protein MPLB_280091 [Mesorhizobium sp. ORS 3324]